MNYSTNTMQTEHFNVRNVKCNGCVATIRKNLLSLPGVDSVEVIISPPSGTKITASAIEVRGTELSRERMSTRLSELGYPVVGEGR